MTSESGIATEWQVGYGPRFGLIEVDRETQERRPKPSAEHFGRIATSEAVFDRPAYA